MLFVCFSLQNLYHLHSILWMVSNSFMLLFLNCGTQPADSAGDEAEQHRAEGTSPPRAGPAAPRYDWPFGLPWRTAGQCRYICIYR